jgi:two-component system alkaline phosphatase synthesis response regulator PhoP
MARVLVVEDEPDIAMGLREDLTRHGHVVEVAADGEAALRLGANEVWDVIVLDVMLPFRDGLEVCRELRHRRIRTPVIMLSARTHEAEKILGLEVGADDYVTKPFSPAELRARIKAVLRRFDDDSGGVVHIGSCEVDFDRAELRRDGVPIDVTALELRLLNALIRARGRVLTREQLIRQAWGETTYVGDRVVDTHILNLRKKLEPVAAQPRFLKSVRGLGYRLEVDAS